MHGRELFVIANGKKPWIVSDLVGGGTPISHNGTHRAVQVGDIVFDNHHPDGIARDVWEKSLHAPLGVTITETRSERMDMGLSLFLASLRQDPAKVVDYVSPVCLAPVLYGYGEIDETVFDVVHGVSGAFAGPDQMSVFSRAHLAFPDEVAGFDAVLNALERYCAEHNMGHEPRAGVHAPADVVAWVRHAVDQGRPALVLAEPTVSWLAHYVRGFLAAREAIDPRAGRADREQFDHFEQWLRARNPEFPRAPWHRIVRAFDGESLHGIKAFLREWDECFGTAPSSPSRQR